MEKRSPMNRKGLSEVVTNVLMILLVIVAIVIIWAFIQAMITKSGSRIQTGAECLTLSTALETTSCVTSGVNANVTVKRGAGEANLKKIKLVFEKEDGSTLNVSTLTNVPGELETKLYSLLALENNPKAVSVAAVVSDDKGNLVPCNPLPKITCVTK